MHGYIPLNKKEKNQQCNDYKISLWKFSAKNKKMQIKHRNESKTSLFTTQRKQHTNDLFCKQLPHEK